MHGVIAPSKRTDAPVAPADLHTAAAPAPPSWTCSGRHIGPVKAAAPSRWGASACRPMASLSFSRSRQRLCTSRPTPCWRRRRRWQHTALTGRPGGPDDKEPRVILRDGRRARSRGRSPCRPSLEPRPAPALPCTAAVLPSGPRPWSPPALPPPTRPSSPSPGPAATSRSGTASTGTA